MIAGEVLYSINDTALGDPNGSYVHFEVRNSTNGTEKTWLEQGMAIGAGFGGYMNGTAMDTNSNAKLFVLSWQTNFVNFNFQDTQLAHGAIMALDPYFQGTQLSPYYFDTAFPVGAGTNVFQILNYFTNIVGFGPDARITFGTSGQAKVESPDNLLLSAGTSSDVRIGTQGIERWTVDPDGHLIPAAGDSYNIGIDALGQVGNAPKNIATKHFFVITDGHTPANSSETNYQGAITWDASNLYIWTATNVNKKVSLTSW